MDRDHGRNKKKMDNRVGMEEGERVKKNWLGVKRIAFF